MDEETLTNYPSADQNASNTPAPHVPTEQDFSGTTLGAYHLVRKVAEGGMGVVYEAIQIKLDRKVALKILTAELAARAEFLQRFEREAKAAAALNHPNVVQVHDFGEAHGWHYLIMEYVEGENLSGYVEKNGKLPVDAALGIIEQAAQALKAAHEKSIIHRDIKPSNLMLTPAGRVKVSDLGLAKILTEKSDVTLSGVGIGSPHYIAPEQADNARHVDHRVDIYSLGLTLLYLLTARRPYEGGTPFSIVLAHVNKPLPSGLELGTELPAPVEKLIQQMSAKNPDDRYQDYDSLLADLQRVKAGFAPTVTRARRVGWTSPMVIIGGVTALVVAVGALAIFWSHSKKSQASEKAPVVAATTSDATARPEIERRGERRRPEDQFEPEGPGGPGGGFGPEGRRGGAPVQGGRRGPGRGQGPGGENGILLPMGPPRQRNTTALADGPVETMLAEADKFAAEHKSAYAQIIDNYWQVRDKATGTPLEQRTAEKINLYVGEHQRAVNEAFRQYEAKMLEKLKTGTPQEAYDVWRDFPDDLRTFELDQQIKSVLEQNLPAGFQPSRGAGFQPN